MTAFAKWAEAYRSGDAAANLARGEALAWKRREAMLELIENNPAKAIELAVPFQWRSALPEKITRHFEEWVDGTGDLTVFVGTDFERGKVSVTREAIVNGRAYQAFVYWPRSGQVSQTSTPIHGIALDRKIAIQPDAVRFMGLEEAKAIAEARGQTVEEICGVSGREADWRGELVVGDIGGEVKFFCGVDHGRMVNRRLMLAKSGANGGYGSLATAANTAWTHGLKNVLYMRVNFPDDLTEPISEAQAYNVMDSVNLYYVEGSYGVTALLPTVTPLMTLPNSKGWYGTAGPGALIADARAAARKAGFETANYQLDIAAFTAVPNYDFGGLAAVHGKSVWLQSMGEGVTDHELGHNYGLLHANYWIPTNSSVIGVGTNLEYGNIFDTMGPAAGGNSQFNAPHKNILDWLPDPSVHYASSNGVYRIYPFDASKRIDGRFYAAKVVKDYGRDYWIEFRQRFINNPRLQYGVLLNWAPWEQSNAGSHLLDTTPGTTTLTDASVVIGKTFSDPGADVHITPLKRGATDTDPWIDVQVNLGTATANWTPYLTVEVDRTNATPGQLVHFHATVEDFDGDTIAYAWSFDDGTFSTNNQPWAFHRWTEPGEHVVRCEVSDMKGGVASANAVVRVGAASGFRISGVILDANDDPIEGVRVDTGNTNLDGYVSGYTDSDGVFVITGLNGDYALEAVKYGYTFERINWDYPLNVSSNMTQVNFLATPLPTVRIRANTNSVSETNTAAQTFTLTRTGGEITNELAVIVYLSGTATIGSDFSLNPTMTADSTNTVIIPAGTQSVSVVFQAVNDNSGEPSETATLTIVDDPAYVVAARGAATITILDNDTTTTPSVSVASVTPMIPENSMDRGTYLFTRNGNIQSDLTVFYSVSGSATAGTDYGSMLGVVIIPAGRETMTVQFQTIDDKVLEPEEMVTVSVLPNAGYSVTGSSADVRITDDDLMTITVFPTVAGLAEPAVPGRFTVRRDGDITGNLVVFYTVDGSATSGSDFIALSGTITIPAGEPSVDIVVTAMEDALLEGDESVNITLTTNVAYNIGAPGTAKLFIRDNEKVSVSVTADDETASEPGDNTGLFVISRGGVVNGNLTVNLAISGMAINGADYVPLDNSVVIPDGSSSVELELIAFDDLHQEPIESVMIKILPSTNYNILGSGQATADIADDDNNNPPAVGFTLATSSVEENFSPGVSVSLSVTSSSPVTVDFVVIGGTATTADYSAPTTVTIEAGQQAVSVPVDIVNDTSAEPNETIRIALFNPQGGTLDGIKIHTYTILDDDTSSVSVTATGASATETGTAGNFRITRSGATNAALQVNFELTGTASAPADFAPFGTSATIPAGATFVDVPVTAVNDLTVEPSETVRMTVLTAPTAKIVMPNVATVTISDNDPNALPDVVVTSTNQPYAVEGGSGGAFVFTRTGSTAAALTVVISIAGTAANGTDYTTLTNSVTIPIGQASVTLPVSAIDDAAIEGEETVIAALTANEAYRVLYPSVATVTIQDNEQRVWLDESDFDASEPGTNPGDFTFTRFGTTNTPVQIFYTISGTAVNGVDYVTITNSFTIPAGSLSAKLPIVAIEDALVEGPETLTITLQSNAAYTLGTPTTATVIVMDDEPMVNIVASRTNVLEGTQERVFFTVQRFGNPDLEFTARLTVSGSATYGVDYPMFATNVFFKGGVIAVDLPVVATNELSVETTETIVASLVAHPTYTILAPSNAAIAIEDVATNLAPVVRITSPTSDLIYLLGTNANMILESTVTDEDTNAVVTTEWLQVGGPDTMSFGDAMLTNTTVSFTNSGVYVLRLMASDGVLSNYADVTVIVDTMARLSTNLLRWTFDDGAGTNVVDASGNARHGTVVGGATWTTNGAVGGALQLSGANNFVREVNDSAVLNGLKQFSMTFWLKSADTNQARGVFSADGSGTNATWHLTARPAATFGAGTNLMQANYVTSRSQAKRVTADNTLTNGWQHIAVTWSNGLAPAVYVNGAQDQLLKHMVTLRGFITNCPQFIVGKGAGDVVNTWNGLVDDVRVFPRALAASEVGAFVATNFGALVEVPTNITVQVLTPVELRGTVTDDGRPNPPGVVSNTWVQISGPIPMTITNANALTNVMEFTQSGDYVFRLIADDGQVKLYQDLMVTVVEPTQISVFASDGDAAELGPDAGPDTGEFTFSRNGDLDFDMTVYVAITGTASNGADVVFFTQTNVVVLPAGTQSVSILVTPYLDDRTEGDEVLTYNIISNVSYSISSGTASVTIHDSPNGVWNVEHFTLEELTDPSLSGLGADFDHDGYVNFVEYAANLNPKGTNAVPLVTMIESNHITLTFQRRLPPTDTSYEPYVSSDLVNWQGGTNVIEEVLVTDDGNMLTETVKARVVAPYSLSTNTFIKVSVRLLTTGPP